MQRHDLGIKVYFSSNILNFYTYNQTPILRHCLGYYNMCIYFRITCAYTLGIDIKSSFLFFFFASFTGVDEHTSLLLQKSHGKMMQGKKNIIMFGY